MSLDTLIVPLRVRSRDRSALRREPAIVEAIGNTPLLPLWRLAEDAGLPSSVELWLKAEWANPGGSIKDRPALRIVRDALGTGQLASGRVLLDATSGNTGIAYAMLGAALGFPVELVVPGIFSCVRFRFMSSYCAPVTLSESYKGSDGAIRLARERAAAEPGLYLYAD